MMDEAREKRQKIAVVTGTRAEFGLLQPVMEAVEAHAQLELMVIAAGAHLIPPALTFRDVKAAFPVADSIPMQKPGPASRLDDAQATGRGIARFARSFELLKPDWVVVLGDRIEAFAAASAASIGGIALAHIHGGDRAEGIADEAMRHAITKLAHLHFPATQASKDRILKMGEAQDRVLMVGSPAIDDLHRFGPLDDDRWESLGAPGAVVLMHPVGRHEEEEEAACAAVVEGVAGGGAGRRVLLLNPNADPGFRGILRALDGAHDAQPSRIVRADHMVRAVFIGLLRRLASSGGLLIGNSSAGCIEAAALGLPVVNVGSRQQGRERAGNVVDVHRESAHAVRDAIARARDLDLTGLTHPYGDGHAGDRIAAHLATCDAHSRGLTRKLCAY